MMPRRVMTTMPAASIDSASARGGRRQVLFVGRCDQLPFETESRQPFAGARDLVELRYTSHRIAADARFARQHHGVDAFVDRVRDVGDLRARRDRVFDHRFEQVRRDDAAASEYRAPADDRALQIRQFRDVRFDAEVAARHHDAVSGARDLVDVGDAFLVLDLRDDLDAWARRAKQPRAARRCPPPYERTTAR